MTDPAILIGRARSALIPRGFSSRRGEAAALSLATAASQISRSADNAANGLPSVSASRNVRSTSPGPARTSRVAS
ncbi:MAG TPA: hypothetical protein VHN14_00220 [Kofleriaceae bacterium]|nr:hypothetical protein [Kofleriaceae bacterium]